MPKWMMPGPLLVLAVLLSGCGEQCEFVPEPAVVCPPAVVTPVAEEPGDPVETSDLTHRRFALVSVDGKDIVVDDPSRRPDIEFNEGFRIAGRVCNSFRGPAELRNGKLYAERLASTMMLCINPELNELERLFHAMLRAGADIALTDGGLTMRQDGHVLVYEEADWVR